MHQENILQTLDLTNVSFLCKIFHPGCLDAPHFTHNQFHLKASNLILNPKIHSRSNERVIISKQDHNAALIQSVSGVRGDGKGADWVYIARDQPITCCQSRLWK